MTTTDTLQAGPDDARSRRHGPGTWRLSWPGVRTVVVLELRQRIRSTRWAVVLGIWVLLLAGLTTLIRFAVQRSYESMTVYGAQPPATQAEAARVSAEAGRVTFGFIVFLVLGLGGLIAPALSATSINGDRNAGVLATLQTTLLTPAEIVVGKLLAAWTVALALLLSAAPFLVWTFLDSRTAWVRLLTVLGLVAVMLLVVCAIGLGWSAIAVRTSSSAVLTYLTTAFLGLGLPLLFAVSWPLVQTTEEVTRNVAVEVDDSGQNLRCERQTAVESRARTERTWWLLAASPFVVVADAAPPPPADAGSDPLSGIRQAVREARLGPGWDRFNECDPDAAAQQDRQREAQRNALPATWPFGLAADLTLGAVFTVAAVRRLRAPLRTLPRGTRVA